MECGYFGKLPARGDFITRNFPGGFLGMWETFLVEGLARSRLDLKHNWEAAYMTMPVWRFYLVPNDDSGEIPTAVAGVVMANVDQLGRKFPLTLAASVDPVGREAVRADAWYSQAEGLLLATLEHQATLEQFQTGVAGLGTPDAPVVDQMELQPIPLTATPAHAGGLTAHFWGQARGQTFNFAARGLPEAAAFRWLLQPELVCKSEQKEMAGDVHGGSREDQQA